MITFMPMKSYRASADALDDARLNKQILEASQIIDTIMDESRGYQNHPAVAMWRPHVLALCTYGTAAAAAWRERRGTGLDRQAWFYEKHKELAGTKGVRVDSVMIPPWVGDPWFHRSHRSNLIRKNPRYYDFWGETPEDMPYLWPRVCINGDWQLFLSAADIARLKTGERVLPAQLQVKPDGEVVES